ncbi:hypothetical protein I553_3272 [Mycobacterium xenopi 4042]|uniref:Uncharacterized protein n=1 Tax=Mycobacterium xenopi 4042 TaxID=1299334 RepID=X8E452_MYCXE|nr:hypothetical protein I552_0957 [Mycobacterium xenopi 3993]EUA75379.1 hypothetical protein I553_3272 [Mycobacterium xenopi 4042]
MQLNASHDLRQTFLISADWQRRGSRTEFLHRRSRIPEPF